MEKTITPVQEAVPEAAQDKSAEKKRVRAAKPSGGKRVRKKKKLLRVFIIAVVLVAAGIVAFMFFSGMLSSKAAESTYIAHTVDRGDISVTITGSGSVAPIQQYDIVSMVRGEILTDNIEVGKAVEKGEMLYSIDSTDAESSIEKSRLSLEKAQLSYSDTAGSVKDLTVSAPISGVITGLFVKNGDNVGNNTKVAEISDTSRLKIKLPFNENDANSISAGASARLCLEATGEYISGTVSKVYSGTYASASGAVVRDVEFTASNPGGVKPGDSATAVTGAYACNDAGAFEYGDIMTVSAKASGEVFGLKLSQGDRVSKGDVLIRIDNSSLSTNITNSELSLKDARLALENAEKALDNYNITSPIAGKIISKTYKAGESVDDNKTTLAVVADMSSLTFTISVDELDISKVSVGQEVKITADALPNEEFTGKVDNISIIGSSQNGVTTYPVKVVIEQYGALLPGMNVNAEIVAQQVTDVLRVPVSAVIRGNMVLLKDDSASVGGAQEGQPQGSAAGAPPSGWTRPSGAPEGGGQRGSWSRGEGQNEQTGSADRAGQPAAGASSNGDSQTASRGQAGQTRNGAGGGGRISLTPGSVVPLPNTPQGYKYVAVAIGLNSDEYIEIKEGLSEGDVVYTAAPAGGSSTAQQNAGMAMGGMGMGGMAMGGMPPGGGGGVRVYQGGTQGSPQGGQQR